MTEAEWLACKVPTLLLKYLLGPETSTRPASVGQRWAVVEFREKRTTDRKLRLFCVACCRRIWAHLTDHRSQRAVEMGEKYADGAIEEQELKNAFREACFLYGEETFDGNFRAGEAACNPAESDAATAAISGAELAVEAVSNKVRSVKNEQAEQVKLLRDIFGNPFRPVAFPPEWRTSTVLTLATQMYESRDFSAMPILADALQDGGCDSANVLDHCRGPGPHVRGCWVVDLVLGKE